MKKLYMLLVILIAFTLSAMAQTEIGFNGVGGRVGLIMPEDPIDNTFGFGLNADLGTISPKIKFGAFIDYWSKSYDEDEFGFNIETSFSVFAIGALARYDFSTQGNIQPYAAGGLGMNFWSSKAESEYINPITGDKDKSEASVDDSDFAIHLIGGVEMPLSPQMNGFAEIKYVISDPEYLGIFVGVMYKLK
ncbi:porin family protein [candidate division KSB1 bacterium]|nr:porin family protein [candidate division KSB1 bacterium]